jgi:hypothetical protein
MLPIIGPVAAPILVNRYNWLILRFICMLSGMLILTLSLERGKKINIQPQSGCIYQNPIC